jgi:hypothetical protein
MHNKRYCLSWAATAPQVISFTAAIAACEKSSQWRSALDFLPQMTRRQVGLRMGRAKCGKTLNQCGFSAELVVLLFSGDDFTGFTLGFWVGHMLYIVYPDFGWRIPHSCCRDYLEDHPTYTLIHQAFQMPSETFDLPSLAHRSWMVSTTLNGKT